MCLTIKINNVFRARSREQTTSNEDTIIDGSNKIDLVSFYLIISPIFKNLNSNKSFLK